jgi:plastocyanin domain-containing protein
MSPWLDLQLINLHVVESGQYGCALTASVPLGEVSIPVAEINQGAFAEISQAILNGTIIEATLTSEGTFFCVDNSETSIKGKKNQPLNSTGNPWSNILGGIPVIVVFRAIFTATAVGLIGFALYKLIAYIRVQKSQFNVPQVCLALEIIANLRK